MYFQDIKKPISPPLTLPCHWYHDPQIFTHELKAVFAKQWWLVAREQQFTETTNYIATTVGKWPIVITCSASGEFKGFHNVCRHRAGPLLHDGSGRCTGFVCRYHGWRYDRLGKLLSASGLTAGKDFDATQHNLFPLRVDCWNGLVFACLDPDTPILHEWLGDIINIATAFPRNADMQWHGDIEKNSAINWKTYADNSCEGYHVGMVHKALAHTVARDEIAIRPYPNGQFVGFDVNYKTTDIDNTRIGKGFWIYKFPALLIHFSAFSFNVESVNPVSAKQIKLQRWFWIDPEKAQANHVTAQDLLASADQIMDEDLAICTSVQRNLDADIYQSGYLSTEREPGTIYFQQLVREALKGIEIGN